MVISGWPPVALIAAIEVLVRMVRPGAPGQVPVSPAVPAELNGHDPAAGIFAAELAAGVVPSIRRIRTRMHVGQPRAREIQDRLRPLATITEGR